MRRFVFTLSLLAVAVISSWAQDKDSEKAAATKKLLQTKISVDYSDDLLQNVLKDVAEKVKEGAKKEIQLKIDPTGAASNNMKITYKAKDKPAKEVLDEMTKKHDLGYMVISGKYKSFGTKYDGFVFITK
jgi:hypothetical protein